MKEAWDFYVNMDPQMSNEECIKCLRKYFPPNVLYNPDALRGPHLFHRIFRDFIVLKGITYRQGTLSNRTVHGVPGSFYDTAENKDQAINFISYITNVTHQVRTEGGQVSPQSTPSSNTTIHERHNASIVESKMSHNVATHIKSDDKFSGKLDENLKEYISNYLEVSKDYKLLPEQNRAYLHNVFKGEVKTIYRQIGGVDDSFEEAVQKMTAKYCGRIRQNRILKVVQSMRLNNVMKEKKLTVPEGLAHVRDQITKLAPQCPEDHKSESSKVEYLCKAVIGAPWARPALSQVYSTNGDWTFEDLYTSLDGAWLQHQEEKENQQKDEEMAEVDNVVAAILYGGQGMYGLPRRYGSKSSMPHNTSRSRGRAPNHDSPGRNGTDYFGNPSCSSNCNSKDHLLRYCFQRKQVTRNINSLVESNPDQAKIILFELCQQTDDILLSNERDDEYEDNSLDITDSKPANQPDNQPDNGPPATNYHNELLQLLHNTVQEPEQLSEDYPEDF